MSAVEFDIRRLARRAERLDPKWTLDTRDGIRFFDLPQGRIRARIAGRGNRTLVFACDMPNVVESYDGIIDALGDEYRILCFEQMGFGFSYPKPGFDFTRRSYIDAMTGLLKAAQMEPYVLVSPCVNVFTAIPVAYENPSLVEHVVLMQAVGWKEQCDWAGWAMMRFVLAVAFIPFIGKQLTATPYLGQKLWSHMERPLARRTHPYVIHKSQERPALFHSIADPLYAAHDHGACACFASAYQHYFDRNAAIPTLSQPTLILWANADRGHTQSDPKALFAYAPNAQWVEIPQTGHHLDLENPAAVSAAIRKFLAS